LQRPGGTRTRGDVAMDQTTAAMLDRNEHVQQAKLRGDGDEKIPCNDSRGVQTEKGRPAQVASRPTARMPELRAHCSWRHPNAKPQEQLIGNAFFTRQGILVRDPANQSLNLLGNLRSTGSALQPPEQFSSRSMPANHCLGAHHSQSAPPVEES
jgi:hypothetical protein